MQCLINILRIKITKSSSSCYCSLWILTLVAILSFFFSFRVRSQYFFIFLLTLSFFGSHFLRLNHLTLWLLKGIFNFREKLLIIYFTIVWFPLFDLFSLVSCVEVARCYASLRISFHSSASTPSNSLSSTEITPLLFCSFTPGFDIFFKNSNA